MAVQNYSVLFPFWTPKPPFEVSLVRKLHLQAILGMGVGDRGRGAVRRWGEFILPNCKWVLTCPLSWVPSQPLTAHASDTVLLFNFQKNTLTSKCIWTVLSSNGVHCQYVHIHFMISKKVLKKNSIYILTKIFVINTGTYRNGPLNYFYKVLKTKTDTF